MPINIKLEQIAGKWKFKSEADLEDFLWEYLPKLFNVFPLRRQFLISCYVFDILAVDSKGGALIIEVKNEEDRYVVSQISRYYDALLQEKPMADRIDYSRPVELIVVSPSFHRDNLTDRKYSQLEINFFEFEITENDSELFFNIQDFNVSKTVSICLEYNHEAQVTRGNVMEPSRRLLNLLGNISQPERTSILDIRRSILEFDSSIKEISLSSSILYGTSKTKSCAELRYDEARKQLVLFLWLPHVTSRSLRARRIVARMRVWTDWDTVSAIGHVPKGVGRMISFDEWKSASVQPLKKLLPKSTWGRSPEDYFKDQTYREQFVHRNKHLALNPHYRSGVALAVDSYFKLIGEPNHSYSLKDLVKLSLKTWIKKH